MTQDIKDVLKLALEALEVVKPHYTQNRHVTEAITAIKEALAQPEQEPVGALTLGGIIDTSDGPEYEEWDIEWNSRAIEALQERLVTGDPVTLEIYTSTQPAQQEPVAWEQFYPDIGKPQIEQPKVRTGDCLLVGVCASEGHKIQAKQEQEEYLSKAYRLANELRCHLAIAPAPQRSESSGKPSAWVGLTDEEATEISHSALTHVQAARMTEALLKEKNT